MTHANLSHDKQNVGICNLSDCMFMTQI